MNARIMIRSHVPSSVFRFVILAALTASAFSQATFPSPTLTSISPLGGTPNSTLELTLRGADHDGPVAVLIGDRSIGIKSTTKVSVPLLDDLPAGIYDIRFVGRYGVSNPRLFVITPHEVVESPGTNAKPDKALKVVVNSAINGVFKAATPHWFTFEAKKGQSVTISFSGLSLDTRAEIIGSISDSVGRELARLKQGHMTFVPPADETYRMQVHELMHRTGDEFGFFGTLESTRPDSPVVTLSVQEQELKIGDVRKGSFIQQAPWTYNLAFKAGDRFAIQVLSHQLGHGSDPQLVIENVKKEADGKETITSQAEVADAPAITPAPSLSITNRDPSYAYEAKADGMFRITLSDNFSTTSPFELRILKEAPKPALLIAIHATLPKAAAVKTAEFGSANVPRNGIAALEVIAPNRNALSEAVELKADSLPQGVTCLGGFIGKGQSLGYIAFQAAKDAPVGAAIVRSIPEAAYAKFAVADAAKDSIHIHRGGSPVIGVSTQEAPASVQTEKTDVLEVAADAKLEIPLKVTRHTDFTDALKLKAIGLVDVAKAPEADIPAKANTGKLTLDMKALKLVPGDYGLILQGPAKMKVRRNLEELAEAEKKAKEAGEEVRRTQNEADFARLSKKNAKTSDDNFAAISKAALEAEGKFEVAKKYKAEADKFVKDRATKTAAKEATFIVYSNPIRIRVKAVAKK